MSLTMVELQMGHTGLSLNEKLSLIQQVHCSVLQDQMLVSSSWTGSNVFFEKYKTNASLSKVDFGSQAA